MAMTTHAVAAASFATFVVVAGDGKTSDVVEEVAKETRRGGDGECGRCHQQGREQRRRRALCAVR